jgi:hypothetical protein
MGGYLTISSMGWLRHLKPVAFSLASIALVVAVCASFAFDQRA